LIIGYFKLNIEHRISLICTDLFRVNSWNLWKFCNYRKFATCGLRFLGMKLLNSNVTVCLVYWESCRCFLLLNITCYKLQICGRWWDLGL